MRFDFVPCAASPNLLHYRMAPIEHAELHRQVMYLLSMAFVCESNSPCAVPTLLTLKECL